MANTVQVKQVSPAERAQRFALMTRQHQKVYPVVQAGENQIVSFQLLKVRLTSKIRLLIEGTLNVVHASNTSFTPAEFAPFNLIRDIRVELNNGFNPFQISGVGAYLYNLLRLNGDQVKPVIDTAANLAANRSRNILGKSAAASPGANNPLRMVIDLPLTVNDMVPVGLILTQDQTVLVTVTITFNDADVLLSSTTGYTVTLSNLTVTPLVESFSIPAVQDAMPDISVIKLVHEETYSISGSGVYTVKLPCGNIYRKLILFLKDASGGEADADLTGSFELLLNQSDTPYEIPPKLLAAMNQEQYGFTLPQGVFVFDFAYQGIPNMGGTRDYIDTERLTEFWVRFNAAAAGSVTVIREMLARLI